MNQFRFLIKKKSLKNFHTFTLIVHFVKSTFEKIYTCLRINSPTFFKNNYKNCLNWLTCENI